MKMYCVYKAEDLTNGKFYIGCTNSFKQRVKQHLACYEKEDCLFHQMIEKHGKDNFKFEIIETAETKEKALELEKKYIKEYNSYMPNGYNMNKGNVGGHNSRAVICLTLDGKFVRRYDSAAEAELEGGFRNTEVLLCCKNKLRSSKKHMFMFEDDYLKNGAKEYIKPRPNGMRAVIQCDKEGEVIARYESVAEAAKNSGANRTTISGVLAGKYKHANGFIFVYEEDFPKLNIEKHKIRKKGRKVAQINPETGEVINVFDRIEDAGRKLGVNYKAIHKVVDMPERTAYGFKWITQ